MYIYIYIGENSKAPRVGHGTKKAVKIFLCDLLGLVVAGAARSAYDAVI